MVKIHPTAIVDPAAQLGEDVEIGPFCVIAADVRIGDGCRLGSQVELKNGTRLGARNVIEHGAVLGGDAQHLKADQHETYLEIGDDNIIREYVTIHRASTAGEATRVGHHNLLMSFVHLGHDVVLGSHIQMANMATLGGHCHIHDRAVIGGLTAAHQRVTVGTMAMVGGMSGINKDVPPYSLFEGSPGDVIGLNTIGLRRNGVSDEVRAELKKAVRLLFVSRKHRGQALAQVTAECASSPELDHLLEFVRASREGRNGRQLEH